MNCFRYLGFTSIQEVNYLMLFEYNLLMKAYQLREVDKEYWVHREAWANNEVKATKRQGKEIVPVYKTFKQFFDFEERLNEVKNSDKEAKQLTKLEQLMIQANS